MNTKTLTPKQQRFVEEYLVDLNATQAAIRAGYSRNSARQMGAENLTKPVIAAAVAEAKRERSVATKIDAEWVLRQAVELHQRCMGEIRPVRNPKTGKQQYDDDGNALFKFNAAAANRALELVGKHVGRSRSVAGQTWSSVYRLAAIAQGWSPTCASWSFLGGRIGIKLLDHSSNSRTHSLGPLCWATRSTPAMMRPPPRTPISAPAARTLLAASSIAGSTTARALSQSLPDVVI